MFDSAVDVVLRPLFASQQERSMNDLMAVLETVRGSLETVCRGRAMNVDDVYWGWLGLQLKRRELRSPELEESRKTPTFHLANPHTFVCNTWQKHLWPQGGRELITRKEPKWLDLEARLLRGGQGHAVYELCFDPSLADPELPILISEGKEFCSGRGGPGRCRCCG